MARPVEYPRIASGTIEVKRWCLAVMEEESSDRALQVIDLLKATSLAGLGFISFALAWTPFGGFFYGAPLAGIILGLSLYFRHRRRGRSRAPRAIALVGTILSVLALGTSAVILVDALTGKAHGLY